MQTARPNSALIVLHILSVLVGLFGFAFLVPIGFAFGMNDGGLEAFVKAGGSDRVSLRIVGRFVSRARALVGHFRRALC